MIIQEAVVATESLQETRAYRSGWHDGRFGQSGIFTNNPRLAEWADLDRLAYYYGHRDGRRIRQLLKIGERNA